MIKKRTAWAFTKFAVINAIDIIMKEIEKEQVIQANDKTSQRIANPLTFGVAEVRHN
jgi:hypothetical protein